MRGFFDPLRILRKFKMHFEALNMEFFAFLKKQKFEKNFDVKKSEIL